MVNDEGVPVEVHILAAPTKLAKQVVRDVQSVALAAFGVELDRRTISVVQLEGSTLRLAPAPEGEGRKTGSKQRAKPRKLSPAERRRRKRGRAR